MDTPQSLSPEELTEFSQALQSVGSSGKAEKNREVRTYDFLHPDKLSKAHMRVIGQIMQGLEKSWSSQLQAKLRMETYVTLESLEQADFSAYGESIPTPCCIASLYFAGLRCNVLLDMPAALALGMVERMAGGGSELRGGPRELSQIECGIIKGVLDRLVVDLDAVWKPVVKLDASVSRFYSSFDDCGASEKDMAVICGFGLEIAGSAKHRINLAIPINALDSVRDKLTPEQWMRGAVDESATQINSEMPKMLSAVSIAVQVELGRATLSMQDILEIGVGDVIKLDTSVNDCLDVRVQGESKFRGRPGLVGSQQAIQITGDMETEAVMRESSSVSCSTAVSTAVSPPVEATPFELEPVIPDMSDIINKFSEESLLGE